ncbi:hypothetical protein PL8927_600297 [Planktothrix serta PCC 8927]|uniref:Uncharacterized protein n=1 Tax=Planktothrix serta PCC 8927 TaxID=671068 RepID=A0A7Z9E1K1_9CYAN|nr:hypothetical protein PL8927_600297 [Planktothrix serta PCC 8927]
MERENKSFIEKWIHQNHIILAFFPKSQVSRLTSTSEQH